jgi:2-methylcitrate dehydratase PrpD
MASESSGAAVLTPSRTLACFAAELKAEAIPSSVMERILDLFVDWTASALAGTSARAIRAIAAFADRMGPSDGPSELLISGRFSSPYFAAMVNAAASHVAEQDDVHNGAVFHPAAVVFPAALAVAQAVGASGRNFLTAAVAGYEVGIRVGEFLGRSHYKVFHTTGTAGTIAAAVAAGRLLDLSPQSMLHAMGSAGTQAAGLWEFLRDAADSKQLHAAHAAGAGITSAYLARDGFTGAQAILEGTQGMAAGMSTDAKPSRLTERLGARWATAETSFKFHASCRHTHPAADALLKGMREHGLAGEDIVRVVARVHQGAIDVLGGVTVPRTVHQAKFSMGSVLGLIAHGGVAGLADFEKVLEREDVADFRGRVAMMLDEEVDRAYPEKWIGKVEIETKDGRRIESRVDDPKGDPSNTLSRHEITRKAESLIEFGGRHDRDSARSLVQKLWQVGKLHRTGALLA